MSEPKTLREACQPIGWDQFRSELENTDEAIRIFQTATAKEVYGALMAARARVNLPIPGAVYQPRLTTELPSGVHNALVAARESLSRHLSPKGIDDRSYIEDTLKAVKRELKRESEGAYGEIVAAVKEGIRDGGNQNNVTDITRLARENLREQLAALCHEQWSGWMHYLFERCLLVESGPNKCPPTEASWIHRWTRQMSTPFADLPDNEKDSDREEADRILAIIERVFTGSIIGVNAAQMMQTVCDQRDEAFTRGYEQAREDSIRSVNSRKFPTEGCACLDLVVEIGDQIRSLTPKVEEEGGKHGEHS